MRLWIQQNQILARSAICFLTAVISAIVISIIGTSAFQFETLKRAARILLPADQAQDGKSNDAFVHAEPYDPDWWKKTVIYQIYPRSYADSDGDGVGDLRGITSRLDYVTSLGVGAIWISPFYESPQDDMGYDVSNFTRVDPLFGTNDDFAVLVDEAHRRGIRVIMDLVPGHTSYKCEWFEKSRNRIGVYNDYYVWHAGDPTRPVTIVPSNETRNGVPNNWISVFGNSMWTWDKVRREYYLHQFLKEQPDLNYRNPLVREEMKNVILFWLDRGADGFRIDAFAHTYEEEPFLGNNEPLDPNGLQNPALYDSYLHTKTKSLEETFLLLQDWHRLVKNYAIENHRDHIFTVTEVYGRKIEESMSYDSYRGIKGADFCFNFNLVNVTNASGFDVEHAVRVWLEHVPTKSWPNWVTGNHDNWRLVSRVGNNSNLIDGFNMLLLLLPGTPTSYYGEEIGMSNNFNLTLEQVRDKNALTPAHLPTWTKRTRDYERTPMQWTSQLPNAGFSAENAKSLPWLPVNENAAYGISVEAQQTEDNLADVLPTTHLGVYKKLVQLRKQKPFILSKMMTTALVTDTLYSFVRKDDTSATYYLVAVDLRQQHNGMETVQYDFSQALTSLDVTNPFNGRIVVLSTATKDMSSFWQQVISGKAHSVDWSRVSLLPGESFVAEFV